MKEIIKEFGRSTIVGVISFIVDSAVLVLLTETFFTNGSDLELFICTAAGFIAGLIVSYILSVVFVFKKSQDYAKKARNHSSCSRSSVFPVLLSRKFLCTLE